MQTSPFVLPELYFASALISCLGSWNDTRDVVEKGGGESRACRLLP